MRAIGLQSWPTSNQWLFWQALSRSMDWSRWKNGRFLCMQPLWNRQARRRGRWMCPLTCLYLDDISLDPFGLFWERLNDSVSFEKWDIKVVIMCQQGSALLKAWVRSWLHLPMDWQDYLLVMASKCELIAIICYCSMMKQSEEGKWLRILLNATHITMNAGLQTNLWVRVWICTYCCNLGWFCGHCQIILEIHKSFRILI